MANPQRIVVLGTTGSGKSTLARKLAERLDLRFVELDDLSWEPGWREAPLELFQHRVRQATAGDAWVVAGSYRRVRDIFWPRADLIVLLDYPFPLVFWRLLTRTFRRAAHAELCCNGNRERLLPHFYSRDSLLWWCIKTYRPRRREFDRLEQPGQCPARVLRLTTPWATERWLARLSAS